MAKQNAFLAKQAEKQARREMIIKMWNTQTCMDALMLTLNDPEYVGKDVFGRKRFNKLKIGIEKYYHQIELGTSKDVSASHVRRQVDDRLAAICGEDFVPWEQRYDFWDDRGI